jgi:polygalacturonase
MQDNALYNIVYSKGLPLSMEKTAMKRHPGRSRVLLGMVVCIAIISFFVAHAVLSVVGGAHAASTCNVKTYGATGNGSTKDSTAIQNAINTCEGGGTVDFPAGKYLTAPLFLLKNNITLDVESGATILGSTTTSDYVVKSGETVDTTTLALINSDGVSGITITGGGVINGQGASWWATGSAAGSRPRLVEIAYGSNITVSNVTLENAGAMHLFLKGTSNVLVNGITISSPASSPNTDGIDPASSSNVTIENSSISDGDDNIAIKAQFAGQPSSGITIKNCTFGSGHGLSIGNDLGGGVSGVTVSNVTFNGTTNGLRIKSTRTTGGDISGVTYTGVTMTNVKYPIWISGYYPDIPTSDSAQGITANTPYYYNITINNLTATGASAAGYIVGVPEKPFTGITLNAVNITAKTGLEVRNAAVVVTGGTTMKVSSGSAYIIQAGGSVTTK